MHIASFYAITFPLIKLQYYMHTIIFSLFPKYFITFLLQHFSTCAHTESEVLERRLTRRRWKTYYYPLARKNVPRRT